ncbi:NADH-dependent flavin oxidoreductase [Staphylococcus lutrae]|uniref:NADH-dependent flavin oxidoreductase n=1 Tax=Staphylococcus lutrae TaxID=155085 RepID=A0AAC9RPG2_9STAP|nr:NADH-dependent flavin oxidoreductase [Staphylococcus lutrae]ARJ51548.1 NADH-dependent flavin oxidoreductase [Staphylococcus lutrae]PNZ39214.1 NADH-dependent flavin oxidoreductase [Staphylococcus lutrae]
MNRKYATLFEPLELPNGATVRNRFVLAPLTHTLSNEDGTVSDVELEFVTSRSKDVGIAITAASYVNKEGKAFPGEPSISKESDIDGLRTLAQKMKEGGAKAVVQIHHGGAKSLPELVPNGDVKAPSAISTVGFGKDTTHDARAMTDEEVATMIKDFGKATSLAIKAGFDGVEIHGANHYAIHQFTSPHYNRRTDQWKDCLAIPHAITDEVLSVARSEGPKDFIVGYRFSPEEAEEGGLTMDITERIVKALIEKPIDYLHVSLMALHSKIRSGQYEGQKRIDLILKWMQGRMPLIAVGAVFNAEDARSGIEAGVPLIALGRGLLFDQDFIRKIKLGKEQEIISYFDPDRPDHHHLPYPLWKAFAEGRYPYPQKPKS